jgi:hypothetical protein
MRNLFNLGDISFIEVRSMELPFGKRYRTYKWIGKSPLTKFHMFNDNLRSEFPWPTKVLTEDVFSGEQLIIRVDKLHWLLWLWYAVRINLYQHYRWLKVHLILTAYVWGLAHIEEGIEIEWRCMGKKENNHV